MRDYKMNNNTTYTWSVLVACLVIGVIVGAIVMGVLTSRNYYNQAVSQMYFSHEGYYYTVTKAGPVQNEPPTNKITINSAGSAGRNEVAR
jgi:hypothetical protein